MQIKILKNKTQEMKDFSEKEWEKADKEHFGIYNDWTKKKLRLVAKDKKEILGILVLKTQAGTAYISTLIVSQEHRREGVGKSLMNKAEEIAKEESCHKIYLETGRGWKAQSFYESLGYKITGDLKKHYWNKDFIILTKWI